MPDALSKTLPIWCSVINRAVKLRCPEFYANRRWDTTLYTFPASVSSLEHREIEKRLDTWARSLAVSQNSEYNRV
jgi:tRNA A64-2'-O-ribosylphosphate transferase